MKQALYAAYRDRYAVLTEVHAYDPADRRIDVLLYHRKERRAIEIKVSRSDLDVDLKHPEKQAPWRELTHKHYYAVPEPLARDALARVPLSSGVIVVSRAGEGAWGVQVKRNVRRVNEAPADLPAKTIQALAYRLAPLEANAKGLSWAADTGAAGEGHEAADRIKRIARDLEIERGKVKRHADEVEMWRQRFAAVGPLWCKHCGAKIAPDLRARTPRRGVHLPSWRHVDAASDGFCDAIRSKVRLDQVDPDLDVREGKVAITPR